MHTDSERHVRKLLGLKEASETIPDEIVKLIDETEITLRKFGGSGTISREGLAMLTVFGSRIEAKAHPGGTPTQKKG